MNYISTAKQTKNLDYNKPIIITELRADPRMLEEHKKRIQSLFKSATEEEINSRINQIVVRENAFNAVMNEVATHFDVSIDSNELEKVTGLVKKRMNPTPEVALEIAKKIITKSVIFSELAKKWEISVTDQEVKKSLENYYRTSNESIREYMENKERFEEVRQVMLEEIIVNELLRRFKGIEVNVKPKTESTQD